MIIKIRSLQSKKLYNGRLLAFEELHHTATELFRESDTASFADAFCRKYGYRELPYTEGYADYIIDLSEKAVYVTAHTFPKCFDNAKVLFFTEHGSFSSAGETRKVCYLAVCVYEGDRDSFLLHIDEQLKVVADECFESMEDCQKRMDGYCVKWLKNKE